MKKKKSVKLSTDNFPTETAPGKLKFEIDLSQCLVDFYNSRTDRGQGLNYVNRTPAGIFALASTRIRYDFLYTSGRGFIRNGAGRKKRSKNVRMEFDLYNQLDVTGGRGVRTIPPPPPPPPQTGNGLRGVEGSSGRGAVGGGSRYLRFPWARDKRPARRSINCRPCKQYAGRRAESAFPRTVRTTDRYARPDRISSRGRFYSVSPPSTTHTQTVRQSGTPCPPIIPLTAAPAVTARPRIRPDPTILFDLRAPTISIRPGRHRSISLAACNSNF